MKLSVSILNSEDKNKMIKLLSKIDISYIHMDVMDGKFVSQKSIPYNEFNNLSKVSNKKLDVHLMVEDPLSYIQKIRYNQNIEYITIHVEIDKDIKSILKKIKDYGFKSGLSIKPNTDLNIIKDYLDYIDLLLIMTVEPGLGGQTFIPKSESRLKEAKKIVKDYNILLEVDGGINDKTINKVSAADIFVAGSYITKDNDPIKKINSLIKK